MKNLNIRKKFAELSIFRVFNIIKKNPAPFFYTIILDFIFLGLIVFLGKYLSSLMPTDPQQLMNFFKSQSNALLFVIIYLIAYYFLILFVYSAVKLSILNIIKLLYKKNKFTLKELGKFYQLNISLWAIFFFTALIVVGILSLILERDFLKYIILILLVPFLFLLYSIINISHTLFIKQETNKLIKKSFRIVFTKIKDYGMFLVWNIVLIIVYLIFYNLVHLIFRYLVFTNQEVLMAYGDIYFKTFNIISIIFIYLLIAFNRIYFYERINKNVLS